MEPRIRISSSTGIFGFVFALVLLAFIMGSVLGESGPRSRLAMEEFEGKLISFYPQIDSGEWLLTLSGPEGAYVQKRFFESVPSMLLVTEAGQPMPDGRYRYELRALSPAEEFQADKHLQSGSFWIEGGSASVGAKLSKGRSRDPFFPLATNTGGNHFVGNLTTDSDLCVGCGDGDAADWDSWPAAARFAGVESYLTFDEDSPEALWRIGSYNQDFFFDDLTSEVENVVVFSMGAPADSIRLSSSGALGLGTSTPSDPFHLLRSDGTAQVRVEETAALVGVRTLFQLDNNGAPRFALKNTSSGVEWSFQQSGPGNFLISREGTGGPEMQVYQNGRVRMGPAGAANFDLAPTGDLKIAGDITADGVSYPSDRNLKTNVAPLDPQEALLKVAGLSVSRWNYKKDDASIEHAGPMAQDFYQLFGLGKDDRHLNPMDVTGVALAAIQGLFQRLQEQETEIESLKAELAEMRGR